MAQMQLVSGLGPQVQGVEDSLSRILKTLPDSGAAPEEQARLLLRAGLLPIIAARMRVRDAGAFVQLMALPLAGADIEVIRILPNREAVAAVAQAADLLRLLVDTVLPSLLLRPTDEKLLRVLGASATKLAAYGREGGGSFQHACSSFTGQITLFTAEAAAVPLHAPYAPLLHRLRDILDDAKALLKEDVTVKHPSAAEAAAAAALQAAEAVGAI